MSDLPPPPPTGPTPPPPGSTPPGSTPPPPPPGPLNTPAPASPPPPPGNLTPPPGYVAYDGAPTPTGTLSRVSGLKTAIVILSIITAIGTALTTVLTSSVRSSADDFLAGDISDDDFIADYAVVLIGQSIQSVGQLALMVVSIIWLFRVAKNVRLFGRRTTWAPIWAVFGWLLPPIFFVIPFLMVREVWKASDPECPAGADTWKRGRESTVVIAWFVLFGLLSGVLGILQASTVFNQGFGGDADSLAETVTDLGGIGFAAAAVTVLAAAAWAMAVREISERHIRLTGER